MFNEKLFFELCNKYGVEVRDGKKPPMVYDKGIVKEIVKSDVYNIFTSYQAYFDYEDEGKRVNSKFGSYERVWANDNDLALAC